MLHIFGINHHTTPLNIRERVSFTPQQLPTALKSLLNDPHIQEAMILSTCNRTEIYTNNIPSSIIPSWLLAEKSISDIDLNVFSYSHHNNDAVMHLMRVACGLNSMIIGEPQVLGQLKEAYFTAENNGAIGTLFKQLFPTVFATSKYVRTNTNIGVHSVSLAYTITQLAKTIFTDLTKQRVLFVGAGETIELIAKHFQSQSIQEMAIANRSIEKSKRIATDVNAHAIPMREIPSALKNTDIVITATASQLPILGKGMIESALFSRKNNPLLLIDLAVPRDIEPEAAGLDNVHLYNIDDLQKIITENIDNRQTAAEEAESIIQSHAELFEKKMRVFQMRHVITQYRDRLEKIREAEYQKALRQLERGIDPHLVIEEFGTQLINKIMHHPTMKIREAAAGDQCIALQQIKAFFETA
ncbi:MAG: glutamyl-tRNA reductase [Coxiellaceae bacterium]|nr:glutamyl-tRNA reductase [Coxiellaceae bacterium]